jgi:hypothetical protein
MLSGGLIQDQSGGGNDGIVPMMTKTPQIVDRLQAILVELRKLRLPAGLPGSALLAVLEAIDMERKALRTTAKSMLQQAPGALPGWRLSGVVGNDGQEKVPGTIMTVRRHEREAALRLIRRKE